MSDFEALVKATLNLDSIPAQLKSIESMPVKLSNISFDTKALQSQLQSAVNGIKVDLNTSNVASGYKKATSGITKALTSQVQNNIAGLMTGTSKIDASIAKVKANYQKLATTNNKKLLNFDSTIKQIDQLKTDLKSAVASGDPSQITAAYSKFNAELQKAKNTLSIVSSESKEFASGLQVSKLSNGMSSWLSKNGAAVKDYGKQIESLKSQLQSLASQSSDGKVALSDFNAIKNSFSEIQSAAAAAGKAGSTFIGSLKGAFSSLMRYVGASTIIYNGIEAMRQMASNALSVDTAMTELYRVSNLSQDQYSKLYATMSKNAQNYGVALDDMINSTANWVKLGFDANTSSKLSAITSMYQHVTDLDEGTAVKDLVTAYKGFQTQLSTEFNGDQVSAVEYIADIYDKLGNEFAVDASDVGEAMQRSASTLSLAGNTIQESTAMATGITEVTQSPEKAGSSLKILSMRLRGMKGELEALGEDVDGNVESISKMQTQVLNLTHGKVNIFDDEGNFKSTYEVMKEIANIYDTLSDTDRADLLETIAGKHRANEIGALIQNWDQVEKAEEAAENAAGTASAENDVYMQSMQGHLDTLRASWQALSADVVDSGFAKSIISGATDILNVIDAITDAIGVFPSIAGIIGSVFNFKTNSGIFSLADSAKGMSGLSGLSQLQLFDGKFSLSSLFNKNSQTSTSGSSSPSSSANSQSSSMSKLSASTINAAQANGAFISSNKNVSSSLKGTSQAAKTASSGMKEVSTATTDVSESASKLSVGSRLATSFLNGLASAGIAMAIQGIITLLDHLIHKEREASEAANDAYSESVTSYQSAEDKSSQLNDLVNQYKELASGGINDVSTRAQAADIQSQITSLVGEQASGLDLVNGNLETELGLLNQIQNGQGGTNQTTADTAEVAYHNAKKASDEAIGTKSYGLVDGLDAVVKDANEADEAIYDMLKDSNKYSNNVFKDSITGAIKLQSYGANAYQKAHDLENILNEIKSSGIDYESSDLYNQILDAYNNYNQYTDDQTQAAKNLASAQLETAKGDDEISKMRVDSAESLEEYRQALIKKIESEDSIKDAIKNGDLSEQDVTDLVDQYIAGADEFSDYYDEWARQFDNQETEVSPTLKVTPNVDIADETTDISNITAAMKESTSATGLSDEAMENLETRFAGLKDKGYDLSEMFERSETGIKLNTDAVNRFEAAIEKQKKAEIDSSLNNLIDQYRELQEQINNTADGEEKQSLISQSQSLLDQINDVANLKSQYDALTSSYNKWLAAQQSGTPGDEYQGIKSGIKSTTELYNEGKVGDPKFKAFAQLMTNEDLTGASIDEYVSAYENGIGKMNRYFTDGSEGCENFLNDVHNLNAEWASMDENGNWKIDFGQGGDKEVADQLGISVDAVEGILGELEEYGFDINYDSSVMSLDEVISKATEAESTLEQATGQEYDFDFSTDNIDSINSQIDTAKSALDQFRNEDGSINLDSDGAQAAIDILTALERKKEELSHPAFMDIDVSTLSGDEADAVSALQNLQNSINSYDLNAEIGLDTSSASSDIQEAVKQIDGLSPEIKAKYHLDDASVQQAIANIENAQPDINGNLVLNQSDIDAVESALMQDSVNIQANVNTDYSSVTEAKSAVDSMDGKSVSVSFVAKANDLVNATSQLEKNKPTIPANVSIDSSDADSFTPPTKTGKIVYTVGSVAAFTPPTKIGKIVYTVGSVAAFTPPTKIGKIVYTVGSVEAFTPPTKTGKIVYTVDSGAVAAYHPPTKTGKIVYTVDSGAVAAYHPAPKFGKAIYHATMVAWNPPPKYGTVTYTIRTVGKVPSGGSSAEGTAHVGGSRAMANGTAHPAFLSGNWGTKGSGTAIVGELGMESVVRNGKFFTIGADSAQLFHYQPHDIIFNAEQTRQILMNGKITNGAKRGVAYTNGTAIDAYSSGSGRFRKSSSRSSSSSSSRRSSGSSSSSRSSSSSSSRRSSRSSSSSSRGGSSSSSSSRRSSSSSDAEDTKEEIDWIEIAIDRIETAIDRLKTVAESAYQTLTDRLNASADEIGKVTEEIDLQSKAYDRYIQQANSVGLSSDLAEKVQNGTIDITEYDQDTADLINKYKDWYDKAIECKDAIDDLNESLGDLYKDRFDNIADDYGNQLDLIKHLTETYNNDLDLLKEKGYFAASAYYKAIQDDERQNISILNNELNDLTDALSEAMNSGKIKEGSEAWYDMQKEINDTKESIDDANLSIAKMNTSIRELNWDIFDFLEDRITTITDEADFFVDLFKNTKLVDDSGQLTDNGMATMGLHGINYNVYMAQADDYRNKILEINKELAEDPHNQDLIDRKDDLVDAQQKVIKAADDEKQAIIDLVSDGIDAEIDHLNDLIDKYKDSMDDAKDLYDYQNKVADKAEEISSLQKQLNAYSGDESEETKAKRQKLETDLSDAQQDLQGTEYDQYISEQEKLLDNLSTEYENLLNQRLDEVDALINDMINTINENSSYISDTIHGEADSVGYVLSGEVQSIIDNSNNGMAVQLITKYGDGFSTALTTVNATLNGIKAYTDSMIAKNEQEAAKKIAATKKSAVTKPVQTPKKQETKTSSKSNKDVYGVALAIINGNYGWGNGSTRYQRLRQKGFDPNQVQNVVNKIWSEGYIHSGAWVGRYHGIRDLSGFAYNKYKNGGLVDYTGIAQVDGTPGNPETVLNAKDTKNFIELKDVLKSLSKRGVGYADSFYSAFSPLTPTLNHMDKLPSSISDSVSQTSPSYSFGDINIGIDHVENYNDFVNQLRDDPKFEKLIQAMTVDRINGGSALAKNKYRW